MTTLDAVREDELNGIEPAQDHTAGRLGSNPALPPERDDVAADLDGLRGWTDWTFLGSFALRLG